MEPVCAMGAQRKIKQRCYSTWLHILNLGAKHINQQDNHEAAAILWHLRQQSTRFDDLPAGCRPDSRTEGDAILAEVAKPSVSTFARGYGSVDYALSI
jgi:hypothetical protein